MAAIDIHRVSLDANRLCRGTQRRFFSGFLESLGADVHIAPTAAGEVVSQVRIAEDDYWSDQLDRGNRQGAHLDAAQRGRIQLAVQREAEAWARELLSPNTHHGWRVHQFSPGQLAEVSRIRRSIPDACFRRRHTDASARDALIIAESAAAGFATIVTENVNSIVHARLNHWLRERLAGTGPHTQQPFAVLASDDFIQAWIEDQSDFDAACRHVANVVAGVSLPTRSRGLDADNRAVMGFIQNMARPGAEMRRTAQLTLSEFRSEYELSDRYREIRRNLPSLTRKIEDDRMARMRAAASAEGW